MAVDDALLEAAESAAASGQPAAPILRLYEWERPTLSLGRRQPFPPDRVASAPPVEFDWVRRATGGLAVLHEHELTYSVIAANEVEPFRGKIADGYRAIAAALECFAASIGVRVDAETAAADDDRPGKAPDDDVSCFDWRSRHETAVAGRKLIGSAQRRKRRAFLQHGSIPWKLRADRIEQALGSPVKSEAFTDLERAAAATDVPVLRRRLTEAFAQTFDVTLAPSELTDVERRRAVQLYSWKHMSLAWVADGEVGERERRWGPPWTP